MKQNPFSFLISDTYSYKTDIDVSMTCKKNPSDRFTSTIDKHLTDDNDADVEWNSDAFLH